MSDYDDRRERVQRQLDRGMITPNEFIAVISQIDAEEYDAKQALQG